ncbi:LTA synthase family protein [Humisphaera borealis]|uniref:Sulfatase-like hydrolase/transferase n=1 Tax=Humisphaera borealis TaxID=2807512 RepID=A0A7M2WY95_9BACT|nr:alkaline phosphatase family protein [Humisphaera borealis]QOV90445.1 sulfatase-like hydrolase/transferase [Humisphaera borealis]
MQIQPSVTVTTPSDATPAITRRYLPVNLKLLLGLTTLLLVLFALLRLGLIIRVRTAADASWSELLSAFVIGTRFDLSVISFVMTPIMIICYLPWFAPWAGPRRRRIFTWGVTLLFGVMALILIAEFEFFNEFQARYNQLAIRYLNHPEIVGGMTWYNFPVVRYLLGWAALTGVIHLGVRTAMRFAGGTSSPARASDDTTASIVEPKASSVSRTAEFVGIGLIIASIVTGVRGGVQGEPLQWGDAFRGDNEFVSQMSLNGLWSLAHAGLDSIDRDRESGAWAKGMAPDEARQITQRLMTAPGESAIEPGKRTALRTRGSAKSSVNLTTEDGRPVNVVVVMMESFSGRFSGSTGAPRSFTPAFDKIAKEGRLFDRAFSAGSHTHQGIFATQLGFPNLPGYETLMESSVSNQEFCSLSSIFQSRGYQTFFLYNGDFAWDNMRGFFRKQGVKTFVGGEEMLVDAKYRDPVWGVSDGDLFDRCNKEFEAASKKGPFMAAIMTLSNHAPFSVPPVPGAPPITDMGELNKRLEAMRYADWAVGKFVEDAKKLSYFKNTLFVFVGDHGFAVRPKLTDVNLLYHHVPLLFVAPGLVGAKDLPGVDHRVAAHMNVAASVLGLIGVTDTPHASWGRSLFDDTFPDENFAVFKMSGGGKAVALARGDELLVLNDAKADPQLLKYTLWPPAVSPATDPDAPNRRKAMSRELRAYVQSGLEDLTRSKAGTVPAAGN